MHDRAITALRRWNAAVADLEKTVGDRGRLPRPRKDPKKALEQLVQVETGFDSMRAQLEGKLKEYQIVLDIVADACQDFHQAVNTEDFGLNPEDPAEASIVHTAAESLKDPLCALAESAYATNEILVKLDKILADVNRLAGMEI